MTHICNACHSVEIAQSEIEQVHHAMLWNRDIHHMKVHKQTKITSV